MKAAAITQIVIQIQLCALTHSAILPIPPNLPSTPNGLSNQPKASSSPNGTLSILLLPSNNTQLNVAIHALPPNDPWYMIVPNTSFNLKLYGYGRALPTSDVVFTLRSARKDALEHENTQPMGRDEVHYSSNKVHLVLHPGEDMTWDTWENTVQILQYFFRAWDNVALFFDVVDDWGDVVEVVARGLLTL